MTVVTWALWLRAHDAYLSKKQSGGCRFPGFSELDVSVGPSFGLFVVGTILYLIVMVHVSRVVRANAAAANGPAPMSHRWLVFFALAAFAVIFVGSIENIWTRASDNHFEQDIEKEIDNYIGAFDYVLRHGIPDSDAGDDSASDDYNNYFVDYSSHHGFFEEVQKKYHYLNNHPYVNSNTSTKLYHKGASSVSYDEEYGVYTAFQALKISLPYSSDSNREIMCPFGTVSINTDDAYFAIVQGGRVTLGFAITATILSFFAAWLQMGDNRNGFWLSTAALCCCVVCLIVWAVSADYIIRDRCCVDIQDCTFSQSYGLIAAGAGFLLIAMFYQAWVLQADIYVLPAHAYGMANELETELQTV